MFERDGFLDARIADIADEASMSHGSFYHYFNSKEHIFREVAEQQEVSLLSFVTGEDGPLDPIERIRAANRAYLTAYIESAEIMKVIEEVSRYDDEVRAARAARDDEFASRLERSIRRLQKEGVADARVDPWYAANILGGMVAKFAEMYVRQGTYELEKALDQLTLLWGNAIGSPSPPS
nr:hypothetical protein GCM10010200_033310 [Actinomadura rugatobispora]